MNPQQVRKTSKFLSLVLRHKPETIGLRLDPHGWVNTQDLLDKMKTKQFQLSLSDLIEIVEKNDKKRFVLSEDQSKIRANQGHSIKIDLQLPEQVPPNYLFHGTAERNLDSILQSGLEKRKRHHVHLSQDQKTAYAVGKRYGKPVILVIDSQAMYQDGCTFYLSENQVWLTDEVAPKYITIDQ